MYLLPLRVAYLAAMTLFTPASAWAQASAPTPNETSILQQRLTDAGCYHGPIDGTSGPSLFDAISKCPDMSPVLRIENGMHTDDINSIAVDTSCSMAATASDDKTVRIWSLPKGELLRVVRLPIGGGHYGKIYTVAISPDKTLLAIGGVDAAMEKNGQNTVAVLALASNSIRRFGPLEVSINRLAFSPDGNLLAVGLANDGLRIFDVASGATLLADHSFQGGIYGLAFAPDGSLIVSSLDGTLKKYSAQLKIQATGTAPSGKHPLRIAVDPSGRRVAMGFNDEPVVSILDANTLKQVSQADTSGIADRDIANVAWSNDSSTLIAGGSALIQGGTNTFFRRFDTNGRKIGEDVPAGFDSIEDVRACGDGFVYVTQDPLIGFLLPEGSATVLAAPRVVDMRGKTGDAFQVSEDGSALMFGYGYGKDDSVAFAISSKSNDETGGAAELRTLAPPKVSGLPVTGWERDSTPKFRGVPIKLLPAEISNALAIRWDDRGFVIGTSWYVRAFDAKGAPIWVFPSEGAVGGVNITRNGEWVVAAVGDGTIRWLRWKDGKECLAEFIDRPTDRSVLWTPSGYYFAAASGEELVGWQVNRGWNQEADFFPIGKFKDRYARVDIVVRVLQTHDEAEAVRHSDAEAGRTGNDSSVLAILPPVIRIEESTEELKATQQNVIVKYALRSPSGLPVDRIDVRIEDRTVKEVGLPLRHSTDELHRTLSVEVPPHDVTVNLVAWAGDLDSVPAKVTIRWIGKSDPSNRTP